MVNISLKINGKKISREVSDNTLLSDFLRDTLLLTGTHIGCDTSQCGACVVHLNDNSVKSCTTLAADCNGSEITTIEGLWLSEIIESISIQTGYDYSSLVNTLTSGSVESKYISLEMSKDINNWEGLLFPDTYKFPIEADGTEIFQKMVDQLEFQIIEIKNSKTLPNWLNSEYELFIVASLVETEAKLDEDRPLVSSVIRNRLELGMPLQIDSTVIYALGERRGQVLLKDLEVDSPYNTYLNSTLPPTPISSFSRASLESVYENLTTNFVYYLLTDKNGDMTFTQSYDEFLELKNKAKEDGVIP